MIIGSTAVISPYSFTVVHITSEVTKHAAYDLKKVSINKDDHHIIYEGQRTIAGKSVDITDKGDVLVKIALEWEPDLPDSIKEMIKKWFKPYTPQRAKAYRIALDILHTNPNATIDEIGIAIKENFK